MPGQESITACMHHTAHHLCGERKSVINQMRQLESDFAMRKEQFHAQALACWRAQTAYFEASKDFRETRKHNQDYIENRGDAAQRVDMRTKQTGYGLMKNLLGGKDESDDDKKKKKDKEKDDGPEL